jgi:hypothetical protein
VPGTTTAAADARIRYADDDLRIGNMQTGTGRAVEREGVAFVAVVRSVYRQKWAFVHPPAMSHWVESTQGHPMYC